MPYCCVEKKHHVHDCSDSLLDIFRCLTVAMFFSVHCFRAYY